MKFRRRERGGGVKQKLPGTGVAGGGGGGWSKKSWGVRKKRGGVKRKRGPEKIPT